MAYLTIKNKALTSKLYTFYYERLIDDNIDPDTDDGHIFIEPATGGYHTIGVNSSAINMRKLAEKGMPWATFCVKLRKEPVIYQPASKKGKIHCVKLSEDCNKSENPAFGKIFDSVYKNYPFDVEHTFKGYFTVNPFTDIYRYSGELDINISSELDAIFLQDLLQNNESLILTNIYVEKSYSDYKFLDLKYGEISRMQGPRLCKTASSEFVDIGDIVDVKDVRKINLNFEYKQGEKGSYKVFYFFRTTKTGKPFKLTLWMNERELM